MSKPRAAIFDLDSTLYNADHRLHLIQGETKDWGEFFRQAEHDLPNKWCHSILKDLRDEGIVPLFVTGRSVPDFERTRDSLLRHTDTIAVLGQNLFMRGKDDRREDTVIKREIYRTLLKPHYDVILAIDDRKRIVKMWREEGILALHCDNWEENPGAHEFDKAADKHFHPAAYVYQATPEEIAHATAFIQAQEDQQVMALLDEKAAALLREQLRTSLDQTLQRLKDLPAIQTEFNVKVRQDMADLTRFHISFAIPHSWLERLPKNELDGWKNLFERFHTSPASPQAEEDQRVIDTLKQISQPPCRVRDCGQLASGTVTLMNTQEQIPVCRDHFQAIEGEMGQPAGGCQVVDGSAEPE